MSDAREILTAPAPAGLLTSEVAEVKEVEDCLRPVEADLCTADWDLQQESFKRIFAEIS